MEKQYWYLILLFCLFVWCISSENESFVSGTEQMVVSYQDVYPLDHPKYTSPQQKQFQASLSEHSALNPMLQPQGSNLATQLCTEGTKCFETMEWHAINHPKTSSPDIINSRLDHPPEELPNVVYIHNYGNTVVPSNSTNPEMRADLIDDIVLPELMFKRKVTYNKTSEVHPENHRYLTNIY